MSLVLVFPPSELEFQAEKTVWVVILPFACI